jgi:hypothetical protein
MEICDGVISHEFIDDDDVSYFMADFLTESVNVNETVITEDDSFSVESLNLPSPSQPIPSTRSPRFGRISVNATRDKPDEQGNITDKSSVADESQHNHFLQLQFRVKFDEEAFGTGLGMSSIIRSIRAAEEDGLLLVYLICLLLFSYLIKSQ